MDNILIIKERDWPDLNRRPSASDWCEFPHSLDYSFTLSSLPVGGGRYVVGGLARLNFPRFSYNQSLHLLYPGEVELGSRLPYLSPDLGFLEFDHIHT